MGIFCGGNGFRLAVITKNQKQELFEAGKTSDLLAPKILELLDKCNISVGELEKIVVGVGPGSFTGSRVAVSFVKGLCCGNKNIAVVPFNTFEFLGFGKKCDAVLVPAFSDFVFVKKGDDESCIEYAKAFSGNIVADEQTFGRWGKGKRVLPNEDFLNFVEYKAKQKGLKAKDLKPVYLRASQAEIEREKRNGNKN